MERFVAPPVRAGEEVVETSPEIGDRVATTTCYMCACRCGIKVHLKDGSIRYIEGNRDHPVNKGVLCAKGSAGIMTQMSPAKLRKPLLRIGERGAGDFKEIEWEEALGLAVEWLGAIRATDPKRLAFFTGRDQSQALTGWWATQFGTPNYAAHGGFCSVNMAAGGLYSIGGSFWEFGEPDWHHTRYFMMFGIAEDHDSNPIKIGLGHLKGRKDAASSEPGGKPAAKFVSVNPIRTGYSAIADEWLGITPGTDGLFVLALVHELLRQDRVDLDYLVRYTNAPWLVIDAPGTAEHGLFARNAKGEPLCFDTIAGRPVSALLPEVKPQLIGAVTLADGRQAKPVFDLMAATYLDPQYAPEAVAARTGIAAETIRRIAVELATAAFEQQIELPIAWTDWAGRRHDTVIGRPVSMHAMRGVSAHSNGFQTCRAIHLLQMILGSIDCPGGFRYKPPFPRPVPPPVKPSAACEHGRPLGGPPLGFPQGPEDLLLDDDGRPRRLDKAYSWEAPIAAHGLMHMVIHNAWKGDPYPIDTLFLYMANMAWNSAMNTGGTMKMLTDKDPATGQYRIPHLIYADAFFSEMVAYADLVLPDTTYLERHDCISLLDRPICDADGLADSIRQPIMPLDRDVRPFQDVMLDLGARLKLPGMVDAEGRALYPGGLKDFMVKHERRPGIGMLAGWRGKDGSKQGKGEPNPDQLQRYIDNGCFWRAEIPESAKYYRHGNSDYFAWAIEMGLMDRPEQIVLQLYSEPLQRFRLAAQGHGERQPPESERERLKLHFDPLPVWYAPFGQNAREEDFPLHALTQRPMHMYHSWGSQNAWLRQIQGDNKLFINRHMAQRLGLANGDWVWIESEHGRVKAPLQLMDGVNTDTVWTWNAIGKRAGAWNLDKDASEATRGFLLNHVISELLPPRADGYRYANADPITGQAAWYDLKVRLVKCAPEEAGVTAPSFPALTPPLPRPARDLRYGGWFRRKREKKTS
ncbi:MAG TPA: molybdopterin oxidoreductase family protein [Dongiaceae bacterium]|nr:molybdopterin oxidoreductase family protein [Dongiaceae bacterium]